MSLAENRLIMGLVVLALALLMWRLTYNFWGWLALFLPGAGLTLWGSWLVFVKQDWS